MSHNDCFDPIETVFADIQHYYEQKEKRYDNYNEHQQTFLR